MPPAIHSARPRLSPAQATLLLLIGLNLLNYIDRYILPGELSLIQRDFHATDHQMGALTTALFIFYMFAAPLTGWLGDRYPRKPLIIAGAVLWSLATLATVWVHGYWTFYIRQAFVGIGEATFGLKMPGWVTDGPEMLRTYIRDELATLGRLGILSYEEQVQAAQTSLQASFVPKVSDVAAAVREPATREEVEREEA